MPTRNLENLPHDPRGFFSSSASIQTSPTISRRIAVLVVVHDALKNKISDEIQLRLHAARFSLRDSSPRTRLSLRFLVL